MGRGAAGTAAARRRGNFEPAMCCFSAVARPVSLWQRLLHPRSASSSVEVARTRIFARRERPGWQTLVYQMELTTAHEVAMILPLPVALPAREDSVAFVDLSAHADFFTRLERLFAVLPPASKGARGLVPRVGRATLIVHRVGAFEASWVPTAGDFDRLDARFRLPPGFLASLPQYADHGFAVFRLAPARSLAIHPMALRFPTRDAARLFFPTVHVHDGHVHPTATFDHRLYWQGAAASPGDETALMPVASAFPTVPAVLDEAAPVFARALRGELPNMDTWVS